MILRDTTPFIAWCAMRSSIQSAGQACTQLSDSTDNFSPTVLRTASKVLRVGLSFGDKARYNASRLMPASVATSPRPPQASATVRSANRPEARSQGSSSNDASRGRQRNVIMDTH